MIQCALCLHCSTEPRPATQLTGVCSVTGKAVDTLRQHPCKDFKVTHIHIFQARGFELINGVARK